MLIVMVLNLLVQNNDDAVCINALILKQYFFLGPISCSWKLYFALDVLAVENLIQDPVGLWSHKKPSAIQILLTLIFFNDILITKYYLYLKKNKCNPVLIDIYIFKLRLKIILLRLQLWELLYTRIRQTKSYCEH